MLEPSVSRRGHRYRPDIDGLRAVAIIPVVGFHFFELQVPGGFVGVDIFFVISGYLITSIIATEASESQFSVVSFYLRRVRRLFPALATVLAFCLVCGWLFLLPLDYRALGKHVAGGAAFVANLVLFAEAGYFDTASQAKPLLHLWSLGIEEQFYLVWPLVLILALKLRAPLIWVALTLAGVSFVSSPLITPYDAVAGFYWPVSRFWELMIGATWAITTRGGAAEPQLGARTRDAMSFAGLCLICASIVLLDRSVPFPGWRGMPPTVGAWLLIAAGPMALVNRVILAARPMVWIGLISYPLYLWHWPLIAFLRGVAPESASYAARFGLAAASVALARLTWRYIELPVRRARHSARVAAAAAAVCACAALGLAVYLDDGVLARYPEVVRPILARQDGDLQKGFDALPSAGPQPRRYLPPTCLLRPDQDGAALDPACVDPASDDPLIILWGDSVAASLSSGLRSLQDSSKFRFGLFAASACPPIIGYSSTDRPYCQNVNDVAIQRIIDLHPKQVVLMSTWWFYDHSKTPGTIERLKAAGIERVLLVSDVPNWWDPLYKLLYIVFRADPLHRIPVAMPVGRLWDKLKASDAEMEKMASSSGIQFASPLRFFCDGNGLCKTMIHGALPVSDNHHLSTAGAVAFADFLKSQGLISDGKVSGELNK